MPQVSVAPNKRLYELSFRILDKTYLPYQNLEQKAYCINLSQSVGATHPIAILNIHFYENCVLYATLVLAVPTRPLITSRTLRTHYKPIAISSYPTLASSIQLVESCFLSGSTHYEHEGSTSPINSRIMQQPVYTTEQLSSIRKL